MYNHLWSENYPNRASHLYIVLLITEMDHFLIYNISWMFYYKSKNRINYEWHVKTYIEIRVLWKYLSLIVSTACHFLAFMHKNFNFNFKSWQYIQQMTQLNLNNSVILRFYESENFVYLFISINKIFTVLFLRYSILLTFRRLFP